MNINECLELAVSARDDSATLAKHEAILSIAMWMRYPSQLELEEWRAAFFCCAGKYLAEKHGNQKINQTSEFSIISKHMTLKDFSNSFSGESLRLPDFYEYKYFKSRLDEFSYLANLAKFIVHYDYHEFCNRNGIRFDKRKVASLNTSWQFVSRIGFFDEFQRPLVYKISWSSFSKFWQRLGSAAAFHYVNEALYKREYLLSPFYGDFQDHVDRIVEDYGTFLEFLGRAKTVTEELSRRLHPRAFTKVCFPTFPLGLSPQPLPTFAMTDDVYREVTDLNRADRDLPEDE